MWCFSDLFMLAFAALFWLGGIAFFVSGFWVCRSVLSRHASLVFSRGELDG